MPHLKMICEIGAIENGGMVVDSRLYTATGASSAYYLWATRLSANLKTCRRGLVPQVQEYQMPKLFLQQM